MKEQKINEMTRLLIFGELLELWPAYFAQLRISYKYIDEMVIAFDFD